MKKQMKMKKAARMDKPMSMANTDKKGGDCMCASCPSSCGGWGLLVSRVIIGALFIAHGLGKFFTWGLGGGWSGTTAFFTSLFGAAGPFLGGLVGTVEIVAGLALLVGIWTRWASYLLIAVLAVAIVWAKKLGFPTIELDLVYIAALFAIAWNSPGRWSLHETCACCK